MDKLALKLDAHFFAVAAAAGAAGVAGYAEASIVHSGPVSIVIPDNIDGVYMNVVSGASGTSPVAGWDINPYSAGSPNTSFNLWGPTTSTWLFIGADTFNLPFGTNIDGAGTFGRPGGAATVTGQVVLNSDQNLFGFRFANEANAGQIHHGWIRVEFGAGLGTRSIVEYAYDDVAGAAIGAGVVPAPASVALLALGAAGLAGRRRR